MFARSRAAMISRAAAAAASWSGSRPADAVVTTTVAGSSIATTIAEALRHTAHTPKDRTPRYRSGVRPTVTRHGSGHA